MSEGPYRRDPGVLIPCVLKWALFLLLFITLIGRIRGGRPSRTPFDQMTQAVTGAADLSNTDQADNQMVRRLYRLTPSDYEGVLLYAPKTNMGAEELLLLHLRSADQEKEAVRAVRNRIRTQKNSFKGYGVEQTAMLEKSVWESRGGYVLYYCGNQPQKVKRAFENAL